MSSDLFSSPVSDLPFFEESFGAPRSVVVDSEGSIIFTEIQTGRIIKVLADSYKVVVLAGSGVTGFKDGKGLSAQFNFPLGVAIDGKDILYVADTFNQAIRRITNDSTVTTILSGTKVGLVKGITYYEATDTIYYTDGTRISRVKNDGTGYQVWAGASQDGYEDGVGEAARFKGAVGISVNPYTGDLYIGEYLNHVIRRIDVNQIVTTVAKGLKGPWGIHVIKNESFIFAEYAANQIKRYSFETQEITTIAGSPGSNGVFDGLGLDAVLSLPAYITFNPLKKEIIFCEWTTGIRVINKFNYVSSLLMPRGFGFEDGPAHKSRTSMFLDLAIDDKEETLYFTDQINNALRKAYLSNGTVTTIGGKPYSGNVTGNVKDALFSFPNGILYYNETLFIADQKNGMIKKVNLTSNMIQNFKKMENVAFLYLDETKSHFFAMTPANGSPIIKYDLNGSHVLTLGSGNIGCSDGHYTQASTQIVKSVYSFKNGRTFFVDYECNIVRVFDPKTEEISLFAGSALLRGYKDGSGNQVLWGFVYSLDFYASEKVFYVTDNLNNLIRKMTLDGVVTTYAGSIEGGYRNGPIEIALFSGPRELRVLSNGDVIVCEPRNFATRIIKKDGYVMTLFGYGSQKYHQEPGSNVDLNYPMSITSKGKTIFVVNRQDNNVIGFNLETGSKFLLAGNGAIGWADGDAIKAMFNGPEGITYNPISDCIFVADTMNHLIRRVTLRGEVTTFAGTGKRGYKNGATLLLSDFNSPSSITTDKDGNLIIADSANHMIRKITTSTAKVSTLAGGSMISDLVDGRTLTAKFGFPTGVIFNPVTESIIVADMYNHAIREINSTHVRTLAGNGTEGYFDGVYKLALFAYPRAVSVDNNGVIYVADSLNDRIRKLALGTVSTLSETTNIKNPSGLHVSEDVLYVSQFRENSIKTIKMGSIGSATSAITANPISEVSAIHILVISLLVLSTSIVGVGLFWVKRRFSIIGHQKKVTGTLGKLSLKQPKVLIDAERTGTMTLPQQVAFAIPGYLALSLEECVSIHRFAGTGGTANVALGTLKDPSLIQKHQFIEVAVKFLNETGNSQDFFYEITLMNSLPKSQYLVELVGYSNNPLAIVMRSYPSNLSVVIAEGTFSESFPMKMKLATDIARGMEIIHKSGVIHFDLKPLNILLNPVNGIFTAVICDFGFANFSSDAGVNVVKGVKVPTTIGITARFAAPELFDTNNQEQINRLNHEIYKKVDVYAYGMTIFNLVTGIKPWNLVLSSEEIQKRVCDGERPEIPIKDVPEEIQSLIKRCWSQDPINRPSFTEILASETFSHI